MYNMLSQRVNKVYIYIYIQRDTYIERYMHYTYTYIHILFVFIYPKSRQLRARGGLDAPAVGPLPPAVAGVSELGKGPMGSSLMGSRQISCFLTEGLFGYSR